jgi:hypothetical protein
MANRKYSDRTPDGTSNPLKSEDLIGVSNEDGSGGFDLSKKITIDELMTFLGVSIADDFLVIGNGTGIEASKGKAGGFDGYPNDFAIAHEDFANSTEFLIWQEASGASIMSCATGQSIRLDVAGSPKLRCATNGVIMCPVISETVAMGVSSPDASIKLKVVSIGNTSATEGFSVENSDNDVAFKVLDDGAVSLKNGTSINEFSIDGTLAGDSDDAVPTEKAVKTYVDTQSGGGWLGSQTRIKIAPWDIVSYNDKDGVSIQNNGGVVNDAAAKITTMVTGVFIPTGYRATAFMINASANIAVELFESQIDDDTQVSKNSGNANTEVNITNVDSTTTNYLSIIIVETGNDIYGGYITIEKI